MPTRVRAFFPCTRLNEIDDCAEDLLGCIEKAAMDANFRSRVTDNDSPILRQPNRESVVEPKPLKDSSQIVGVARTRLELQRKLKLKPKSDQAAERSKQRWGPCTKVFLSSDQIRVVTSMVSGPILISFTEEGRPPRDRLDTVPAVEITVPLRVCSM